MPQSKPIFHRYEAKILMNVFIRQTTRRKSQTRHDRRLSNERAKQKGLQTSSQIPSIYSTTNSSSSKIYDSSQLLKGF